MACYNKLVGDFKAETDIDALAHEIEKGADGFATSAKQWDVWKVEIELLRGILTDEFNDSRIVFEYTIPRIHKRLDVALLHHGHIFILEFKGHEKSLGRKRKSVTKANLNQVETYARYLKACHSLSHECVIFPVLVAIDSSEDKVGSACDEFSVYDVSIADQNSLLSVLKNLTFKGDISRIGVGGDISGTDYCNWRDTWVQGAYSPSPNIIETTVNRFRNHKVEEIRSSGASANDLSKTVSFINSEVSKIRKSGGHAIFFVTGVPGAGKTLIGLDVVATNLEEDGRTKKRHGATFLSGNGPLVDVLSTALKKDADLIGKSGQSAIANDYKTMVTHVHDFRRDILPMMKMVDGRVEAKCPGKVSANIEHLVVFDEAQRAFDLKKFTQKGQYQRSDTILQQAGFPFSEPGFMLWVMSQHPDWGVIVCLVGGGQEINTGESGICEWLKWLAKDDYGFKSNWKVYVSEELTGTVYGGDDLDTYLTAIGNGGKLVKTSSLHLSVPKRSRSSQVDRFIERLLSRSIEESAEEVSLPELYKSIVDNPKEEERFLIYRTRSIDEAKVWLRQRRDDSATHSHGARKDRIGLLMSSNGYRLRPLGFPALTQREFNATADWFLSDPSCINSSDFMEVALHEMFVQGLELDWVGLLWDADFRPSVSNAKEWEYYSGISKNEWTENHNQASRQYQYNAYRVLLTRARKGMVIVVPEGDVPTGDKRATDPSRNPEYYDRIYNFLGTAGIVELQNLPRPCNA